jgi:hypothetical protein
MAHPVFNFGQMAKALSPEELLLQALQRDRRQDRQGHQSDQRRDRYSGFGAQIDQAQAYAQIQAHFQPQLQQPVFVVQQQHGAGAGALPSKRSSRTQLASVPQVPPEIHIVVHVDAGSGRGGSGRDGSIHGSARESARSSARESARSSAHAVVPEVLARRGVVAYDTPRAPRTQPKELAYARVFDDLARQSRVQGKCRAPGCKIAHNGHYCPTCRDDDANHHEYDCPVYKHH